MSSVSRPGSALFRALVLTAPLRHRRGFRRAWFAVYAAGRRRVVRPVTIPLHGRLAMMNFGYAYPLFRRDHPAYNQPLVEAVRDAVRRKGAPISFVDVGAAIGDTVLLLEDELGPDALSGIVCVDGDDEFTAYLRHNLGHRHDVLVAHALVSRQPELVPGLIRTHAGTASAQGSAQVIARTLDDVLHDADCVPDVIKVDTDGFDGAVLAGAARTLSAHTPDVVFEWHPRLLVETGNPLLEAFEVLRSHGYRRFSLFDRYGQPAHVVPDDATLTALAHRCRTTGTATSTTMWSPDVSPSAQALRIAVWHNLPSGGGRRLLAQHLDHLRRQGHELRIWTTPLGASGVNAIEAEQQVRPLPLRFGRRDWAPLPPGFVVADRLRAMHHHLDVVAPEIDA